MKKAVFSFFGVSLFLAAVVVSYTLWKDPYCNNCKEIDLQRHTVNSYYDVAQILKANPDAEVVIVGTSRGQGFSPKKLGQVLNKKVLNLSVSGSGVEAKIAFIELAKKMIPLKLVIWQADYFEILGDNRDSQLHAMKLYAQDRRWSFSSVKTLLLQSLDHTNFEAAVTVGRQPFHADSLKLGYGSDLSDKCFVDSYVGKRSEEELRKQVQLLYHNYTRRVFAPQESSWKKDLMRQYLSQDIGVDVIVAFVPYHPNFTKEMAKEFPVLTQAHLDWMDDLQRATGKVQSFMNSVPEDDGSAKYWDDGTHFTCYTSHLISERMISKWQNPDDRKIH
ncbi:hypothetical protein ACES2J_05260 [Bdellovibrio bacteriovorus]|uniref:hypothetical protein n=1 Tax=Bdellovibrio bacteriovorus TaxID=959 RepID=UPI0035A5E461